MQTSLLRTVNSTLPWDDAPVDISFLFADEKPAGKHGFLTVKGDKFVFEDGTEARFWGTNFNSAANFPSHEYSHTVARRLAKFGVNLVRFHQLDAEWSTPNIFNFRRGPRINDTRKLDPESMERLDYLIYALKEQGIYVYLDMLTYRKFRTGDGARNAEKLGDAARPVSLFDSELIQRQKEFCDQIWNHFNPYTKLAYKDDPVIVLTEITNEKNIHYFCGSIPEPYRTELEERYLVWRREQGLPPVTTPVDLGSEKDRELVLFKMELQKAYYEDMLKHMKSIGVRIPVTGTNWAAGGVGTLLAQAEMPFMDSHTYFYGWSWKPHDKRTINRSFMEEENALTYRGLTFVRTAGKPFFVSEWDEPWPNEWRAESVLNLAAVSAFQGWSGTAIHTYRYDNRPDVAMIAEPVTSDALAGIPYRSGVFDAFNDPCRFGLFYHAAIILRRGDVAESSRLTEINCGKLMRSEYDPSVKPEEDGIADSGLPAWNGIAEISKVASRYGNIPHTEGAVEVSPMERTVPENLTEYVSDTGELRRDRVKRIGIIDTPRTKVVYGFIGGQEIKLKGMTVRCKSPFAVIALSSLSDKPLDESDNILLTAVGRADNTDAKYNDTHTVQFELGHAPIEAEVIEAEITLDTKLDHFRADAVNMQGLLAGPAPAEASDGKLKLSIGGDFASIYYIIQTL